ADRIMARISKDENLHMIFYRDLVGAALHLDPSRVIEAIAAEVQAFVMPGAGMRDFNRKAVQIAKAGIYDLRVHHDDVIWPLLRHWGVFDVEGLDEAAEQAREQLSGFLTGLDQMATRFDEKRTARAARETARTG
ncbi:MAG: acyl-ACP desaturase, partial [Nitriliruptor sp.]